jgi:hypothetical protein
MVVKVFDEYFHDLVVGDVVRKAELVLVGSLVTYVIGLPHRMFVEDAVYETCTEPASKRSGFDPIQQSLAFALNLFPGSRLFMSTPPRTGLARGFSCCGPPFLLRHGNLLACGLRQFPASIGLPCWTTSCVQGGNTRIDPPDFLGQFLNGLCSDSLLLAKCSNYRLERLQLEPPWGSTIRKNDHEDKAARAGLTMLRGLQTKGICAEACASHPLQFENPIKTVKRLDPARQLHRFDLRKTHCDFLSGCFVVKQYTSNSIGFRWGRGKLGKLIS